MILRYYPPRAVAALILTAALGGCSGGSDPDVPTIITLSPTNVDFTSVGQTQQLTASIVDQRGDPVENSDVIWDSSEDGVATVSPVGVVTATGPGTGQVTATLGEIAAVAQVSVTQTLATFQAVAGDGQTAPAGQALPQPLVVEARDLGGNPIPGLEVRFTVTEGGGSVEPSVASTGPDGRASTVFTLGSAQGSNHRVQATVTGTTTSVTFAAAAGAPATGLTIFAGNGQSAPAGAPVPVAPAVRILDQTGQPVAGAAVQFTVTRGGGSVANAVAVTSTAGVASSGNWILGPGGVNTLTASVPGLSLAGDPALFVATVRPSSGFDIQIRHQGSPSSAQLLAFAEAEVRWESLITGDLPNVQVTVGAGSCGDGSPALNESVDDLLILANLSAIDGPGNVLGAAGPCFIRVPGSLPIVGQMRFDTDDLAQLEDAELLGPVILHEMAHVLGFGTLWSQFDLLEDPHLSGGLDPHFTGPLAIAAFDAAGGATYSGGKVPVEDCPEDLCGGSDEGTADSHWRESVFGRELMTGFVALGSNPLSRITLQAFADEGYTVTLGGADDYTVGGNLRSGDLVAGRRIRLHDDIAKGPIFGIDASGTVVGEVRR